MNKQVLLSIIVTFLVTASIAFGMHASNKKIKYEKVTTTMHPFNQCVTIMMSEARKDGKAIDVKEARENCLELLEKK